MSGLPLARRFWAGALLSAGLVVFCGSARADGPVFFAHTSVGYYAPTSGERQVHSTFASALLGAELWRAVGLDLYAGVTLTGASGYVLVQAGSGRHDVFGVDTAGAGPVVMVRADPLRTKVFSVGAEVLGAVLFYARPFPPHGDIWEFALRVGGVLAVTPDPRLRLELSVHYVHVAYDGVGAALGVQITL